MSSPMHRMVLEKLDQRRDLMRDDIQLINGHTAMLAGYTVEDYDDDACISQGNGKPFTLYKLIAPDGTDLSNNEARYSVDHALEDAPDFYGTLEAVHSLPIPEGYVWKIISNPNRPEYMADILDKAGASLAWSRSTKHLSTAMLKAWWWMQSEADNEPVFTECPRCNGAMEDGVCTFCGLERA